MKFNNQLGEDNIVFTKSKHLNYINKVFKDAFESEGREYVELDIFRGSFEYNSEQFVAVRITTPFDKVDRRINYRLKNNNWATLIFPICLQGLNQKAIESYNFDHIYGLYGWSN